MELNPETLLKLLSTDEMLASAWTVLTVTMVVQTFKIVFKRTIIDPNRRILWVLSLGTSMVAALYLWPESSTVHPVIAGVVLGPATNMAFWGAAAPLKRFAPSLWAILNADRRRRRQTPPGGLERREP